MYEEIQNWLCNAAQQRNIHATFHIGRARQESGWLHLPVRIEGEDLDAGERADRLQDLEDAWNEQEPKPNPRLLLIPAKN